MEANSGTPSVLTISKSGQSLTLFHIRCSKGGEARSLADAAAVKSGAIWRVPLNELAELIMVCLIGRTTTFSR